MKKISTSKFVVVLFLLLTTFSFSQVELIDSFKDGNFTLNPTWIGETSAWTVITTSDVSDGISGSYTLRLNVKASDWGTSYLSTQRNSWGTEQSWGYWFGRRSQPVNDYNQSIFWLWASESNLESSTVNGYRIKFGDGGDINSLILERVDHGIAHQVLVSSEGTPTGLTDIGILVWVVRFEDSRWQIFTSPLPQTSGTGPLATRIPDIVSANVFQGEVIDTVYTNFTNGFFGVMAAYSPTRNAANAAEFDQIYFSEQAISLLPVELFSFTGFCNDNSITLNWETKTEVNNYGFDVERKTSIENWQKLGFIQGNGNSNSPKYYEYTDNEINPGKYYYRLKQVDNDGSFEYSNTVEVNTDELPDEFMLGQNFPNPFNPSTKIKFAVRNKSKVRLIVYNVLGNQVATLFNDEAEANKVYEVEFSATGGSASSGNAFALPSGIYIYRLESDSFVESHKMLLIK